MKSLFIFTLFFLFSCGQDLSSLGRGNSGRASSNSQSPLMCSCSDNKDYVCGTSGELSMTFLNACIAQCNGFSYTEGACQAGEETASCNPEIKDVCGQPACADPNNCPSPGIYNDQCSLVNSGATQLDMSECVSP